MMNITRDAQIRDGVGQRAWSDHAIVSKVSSLRRITTKSHLGMQKKVHHHLIVSQLAAQRPQRPLQLPVQQQSTEHLLSCLPALGQRKQRLPAGSTLLPFAAALRLPPHPLLSRPPGGALDTLCTIPAGLN